MTCKICALTCLAKLYELYCPHVTLPHHSHSRQDAQIDRLLIRPLTEYQLLLSKVENIIKKRNHKLLDYDRHRTALKKMTENTARKHEMSEEKRIIKQEQQVNYATMEYERYNNLLKVELPHLMELRAKLIEPGIETLISFQRMFYTKGAAIFSGAAFGSLTKTLPTTDAQHKYDAIVEPILRELRVMGLFHGTAQSTKSKRQLACWHY